MTSGNRSKSNLWYWSVLGWIAFAAVVPYYGARMLFAKKYRTGLKQRLTLFSPDKRQRLKDGPYIWFHTVSVGELQAARPLIRRIKKEYPDYKILVSTVTETGQNLARQMEEISEAIYLPLDMYRLCRRVLNWVCPVGAIVLETEIWPNFIRAASDMNVPLILVNGRISDQSFWRYRLVENLFAPVLNRFDTILTQSREDSVRFVRIGASRDRVTPVGNLKFETTVPTDESTERNHWRTMFGVKEHEILLLGGSTFPGEELLLARVLLALKKDQLPVRLAIAPRHVERTEAIMREMEVFNLPVQRRSQLKENQSIEDPNVIILLDTIGELRKVYAAADIVFLGKSLLAKGGQNPIEPAAWGKPILFGPNMQNFRDICSLFLNENAALSVLNENELIEACRDLCRSSEKRRLLGEKARSVVMANQGTIDRVMEAVRSLFPPAGAGP